MARPPAGAATPQLPGAAQPKPANSAAVAVTAGPWKARPVFISSTFKDMHAERGYLRTHVFPRLEEELRKRRHQLEPIDLRFGVESGDAATEEARELLVLKVCLGEIQKSRPFLLVLLGDRNGWVPPADRLAAAAREAGFQGDLRGRSVTALEIEYGIEQKQAKAAKAFADKCQSPLVVTDDDVAGTFTFLRALSDYPHLGRNLTAAHIGDTWLNYLVEGSSVLWWGGFGSSTEHTAYLRLKQGYRAPQSGSAALNGSTVAEQIGAQIFIDGWGMIAPGDPELAAEFARKAGSVSHDGESIYGAQVIAAMEALAFVQPDLNAMLDGAVRLIPRDSTTYRLIADLREWHAGNPDWRVTREKIVAQYGYAKYPGNCHIIPNHALIHLGLLYGGDDFQKALMITNTSGWDTDCNSGNVGCVMGLRLGLAGIEAGPDWRGPVADRLFLSTADGGRCITDAVQESVRIANLGRQLQGAAPLAPKAGARFHFEAPGAVQGFETRSSNLQLENTPGHSLAGARSLALRYRNLAPGTAVRAATTTFIQPADLGIGSWCYNLHASPTLYAGQTVRARLVADAGNTLPVQVQLYLNVYGDKDQPQTVLGPAVTLAPGADHELQWRVADYDHQPIYAIGLELSATQGATGAVYLDSLTWEGTPTVTLTRPAKPGAVWQRAWVSSMDKIGDIGTEPFRLVKNEGRGLLIQGAREWQDYRVQADIKPLLCTAGGLAAYVQGLRRYYALLLAPGGKLRLMKMLNTEQVLAEADFAWVQDQTYQLALEVTAGRLRASVNGQPMFEVVDSAIA